MVGENVVPEERRKRFDRLQASAARLELLSGPRFRATVKTPIDALAEWVVEHTREIEIQVPGGILFLRCPEQGFTALSPRGARRMALQGRYIPFENPVTRLRGVQASDGGEVSVTPAEAGVQASHVAFYGGLDSGFRRNDEAGGLDSGFRRNDEAGGRNDDGLSTVTPVKTGVQASYEGLNKGMDDGGLDSGFRRNDEAGGLDSGFRRNDGETRRNDGDDNKSDEAVLFVGEVVCFRLAPLRGRGTELQAWVTSPAPIEPVFKLMDQIGQTADRGLRWPALVAYWLTQFLRSMDRRRLRRLEEWPPIAGYATDADPQVEATPAGVSPASSPIQHYRLAVGAEQAQEALFSFSKNGGLNAPELLMELFEEPAERPRQRFFLWAREQETSALALPATGEATLTFVPSAGGEATLSIARPEDDADLAAFCAAFLQELSRLGYLPAPTETLTKELVPPLGPETPRKPGESDGAADRAAGRAAASGGHDEPWRVIKGKQEREMVRLWWQGYTKPEIAKQFGIAKVKTLENLFSTMRGTYGRKVVPTLDDLRRRKIR